MASTTIIHKPTDTMVEFDPEAKTCTLRSVPGGFDPDVAVIHAFSMSANNKTVTPADAVHVFQLNHRKGLISLERRRSSCSALLIQLDITPTALVLREELQMNSSLATTLVIGVLLRILECTVFGTPSTALQHVINLSM